MPIDSGVLTGTFGEVSIRVLAGRPTDADMLVPRDGLFVLDSTDGVLWVRVGGVWMPAGGTTLGCRVYKAALQTITTGVDTALTFDSERWDTVGLHDNAVNNTRITIPTGFDGKWEFGGTIAFAANATGYREVYVRLNGSAVLGSNRIPSIGAAATHRLSVSTVWDCIAGDYAELVVGQNSGGNLDVVAAAAVSPEFWCFRVGQ